MKRKEKILICGILPPPLFGHSSIYKILMESAFIDDFDISFLNMRFWSYRQHKKVNFVKLLKLVKYLFQYIWIIAARRPRYVLYNMSFDKMPFLKDVLFCFIGKICGCRIILHDMGQYVDELYQSSGKVYQALLRWLLKNTTACILLGESAKQVYKGFIAPHRLFSVPGSVEDTKDFIISKNILDPLKDSINVLYFSFMAKSKGVFTAFEAASNVLRRNQSICFHFAGPIESASVQEAFDRLKDEFKERVRHLGYIEATDIRTAVYRSSDIFIFPTHRDVFGLVLLHAMAESLPIIASREGTIPEIIKDGEGGFLIEKGDHEQLAQRILQLAGDPVLRKAMGASNRKRYEEMYLPQKYGARMVQVFDEIIAMD